MKLLIDVGNTRLKWSCARDGRLIEGGSQAHEGEPAEVLSRIPLDFEPGSVAIASVAGPVHGLRMAKACLERWNRQAVFASSEAQRDGLHNGYVEPGRLGVDRWLAMLAAWKRGAGACVVADAGTALTVDAVDAQGRHLGGIIAAGLRTSERAVLGATRFPVRETPLPMHAGLGLDTEACVRQGAMLSVLGALDRAAALVPDARRYLCGGDAAVLAPLLGPGWEHRPQLVLEGLLASIEAA